MLLYPNRRDQSDPATQQAGARAATPSTYARGLWVLAPSARSAMAELEPSYGDIGHGVAWCQSARRRSGPSRRPWTPRARWSYESAPYSPSSVLAALLHRRQLSAPWPTVDWPLEPFEHERQVLEPRAAPVNLHHAAVNIICVVATLAHHLFERMRVPPAPYWYYSC
jgi:hypothetical protein